MAYTNIKTEIDGKIYTNILREITGDILNEVLKKMVDSLGKGYRYMGILEPDGSRPSGDENMFMVATEAGYYTALANDIPSGITICSFSEGSIQVETILNLDEIFSGNHNWGGNNTFSAGLKVAFESLIDLNSDENLQDMLNALMPRVQTAVENHIAAFDAYGRAKDSGVSVDDLAKKDGISEKLVSGSARGILSPSAIEELFLFQRTANGAGGTGAAVFQSIKGNSIAWNQLIKIPSSQTTITVNGVTFTDNRDGTYTVQTDEGGATAQTNFQGFTVPSAVGNSLIGHKVLLKGCPQGGSASTYYMRSLSANDYGEGGIGTPPTTENGWPRIYVNQGTIITTPVVFRPQFFDLTLMFGAGKEPASVAEFNALYPGIYAPNPGAIKNNCATGMVTDGFNQWDEETELGAISFVDGRNAVSSTQIRSKNYIRVLPGASYFFKTSDYMWATGYDADKNYIGGLNSNSSFGNVALTIPANVYYIRFWCRTNYGTTYKNDICINLSGSRNGEYEPHWSDTTDLPITTATGKLNGEGESVVISPNGLAGVGTSYDEAIVEKGMWTKTKKKLVKVSISADDDLSKFVLSSASVGVVYYFTGLGNAVKVQGNALTVGYGTDTTHIYANQQTDMTVRLTTDGVISIKNTAQIAESITAEQARTLLAGMEIWVELATEQLYILDTPVPVVARVDENGMQTILPQGVDEQGTPMTAPFKASIQYPVKLGVAPIGQQSLVNLLEKMKSAGKIASYTMVWDATTGVYDFTIS